MLDTLVGRMNKGKQREVEDGYPYLASLNCAQKEAVTWSSRGGLQILAGPGSGACFFTLALLYPRPHGLLHKGKTRVLTCRVAFLIKECNIKPEDLIVVTFTNKVELPLW